MPQPTASTRRRVTPTLGTALLFAASAAAPAALAAQGPAEQALRAWNERFEVALARNDTTTLRTLVSDDLTFVAPNGGAVQSRTQLFVALATRGPRATAVTLDSVQVQRVGEQLVLTGLRTERTGYGITTVPSTMRVVQLFQRGPLGWRLTHWAPTWSVAPVPGVKVPTTELDAFVGNYELAPGYVDRITREGEHLVSAPVGQQRAGVRLLPTSHSTFRPDGGVTRVVFERDAQGTVTGYVLALPDGRSLVAPRLP